MMEPAPFHGKLICADLKKCLYDSGAALVLHGKRDLVDSDLAQLRNLSEREREAITCVVVSDTVITGDFFHHLAALPNLKALYANKTRIDDEAPFERLPKTLEVVNLDHTYVGDACVSKLRMVPNLYSVRLRKTNITHRGVAMLASMTSLRDCVIDETTVNEFDKRRLLNAIVLQQATCRAAFSGLLCSLQLAARWLMSYFKEIQFARCFRLPLLIHSRT